MDHSLAQAAQPVPWHSTVATIAAHGTAANRSDLAVDCVQGRVTRLSTMTTNNHIQGPDLSLLPQVELLKQVGFDKAFNYKTHSKHEALDEAAPDGIDIYW